MRVTVVNFCSTAVDMLDFSSDMLIDHAGTDNFDYLITTWNPTTAVQKWIIDYKRGIPLYHARYETEKNLDYVPNLRAMFNFGFSAGYKYNDWVAIVNTDMAFGSNWLANLVGRATEDIIPNSLHLSPIRGPNIVTIDLGEPVKGKFNLDLFWKKHAELYEHRVETEEQRGSWQATNTLPYIMHQKWWEKCGPWRPNHVRGQPPPDRQFFQRCHDAGARFVLVHDSIAYHHEAVERRSGVRPIGIEDMPEGM